MIGIYYIKNKVNGKIYIGKAKNVSRRLAAQKCNLTRSIPNKKLVNKYLYKDVKAYGWNNFETGVLESFETYDSELLSNAEGKWMMKYNSTDREFGYNIVTDYYKKRFFPEEFRQLKSSQNNGENNPNYNHHWSKEQRDNMSKIAIQRHQSGLYYNDEWKQKLSKASKEIWKDEEKKAKMAKKVSESKTIYEIHQYDRQMNPIKIYDSVKDVIKENPSYKWQNIYSVCNGYKKTYMGYVWIKSLKK